MSSDSENTAQREEQKNIFDHIGDFFARMLRGILVFVFCKLPIKIWKIITNIKAEQLKKVFKYSWSIGRMIVLGTLWIAIVFLGWWFFLREQFVRFWGGVFGAIAALFGNILEIIKNNAGWIWMCIALCGSAYGLLYVTLKKRAINQGKEFQGVFGWLKKPSPNDLDSQQETIDLPAEKESK